MISILKKRWHKLEGYMCCCVKLMLNSSTKHLSLPLNVICSSLASYSDGHDKSFITLCFLRPSDGRRSLAAFNAPCSVAYYLVIYSTSAPINAVLRIHKTRWRLHAFKLGHIEHLEREDLDLAESYKVMAICNSCDE